MSEITDANWWYGFRFEKSLNDIIPSPPPSPVWLQGFIYLVEKEQDSVRVTAYASIFFTHSTHLMPKVLDEH